MAQPHGEAGPGRVGSASLVGRSWLLRRRHTHDAEAEADVTDAGVEPQPASGAAILRGVIPRAAAQDALLSPIRTRGVLARTDPVIAPAVAVGAPLTHVTVHVEKAEAIRPLKGADL